MSGITEHSTETLFGRSTDLTNVLARFEERGLTVITGAPHIGKTRLIKTALGQLSASEALYGLAEYSGQEPDLLLRSVVDLYSRWISQASFHEEARALLTHHRGKLSTSALKLLSTLVTEAVEFTIGTSTLVSKVFADLFAANVRFKRGASVRRLQYEEARDLVNVVHQASRRRVLIVLDQFEDSLHSESEVATLHAILRHLAEWPPAFHIAVVVRETAAGSEAERQTASLVSASSTAKRYHLGEMGLDDPAEQNRLHNFLQLTVPAVCLLNRARTLEVLRGYPGTLARWVQERPTTVEALIQLAEDAQAYRYGDLDKLLESACQDSSVRMVLAQLAIIPEIIAGVIWDALKPVILRGNSEHALVELESVGILQTSVPVVSFGSPSRHATVRRWFLRSRTGFPFARTATKNLVDVLGQRVRLVTPEEVPFAQVLTYLIESATAVGLGEEDLFLCYAARTWFGERLPSEWLNVRTVGAAADAHPESISLIAFAISHYFMPPRSSTIDWSVQEALLNELISLTAGPEQAIARRWLAAALSNAATFAHDENRPARGELFLDQLRDLANQYADEIAIANQLATGLYNRSLRAKLEHDRHRIDALREALQHLASTYPGEPEIRQRQAGVLCAAIQEAGAPWDIDRRAILLGELRALAMAHAGEAALRSELAAGLFLALQAEVTLSTSLLEELRQLATMYCTEPTLLHEFVKALAAKANAAKGISNDVFRDQALSELRDVAAKYSSDEFIREIAAGALYNACSDASQAKQWSRSDALLTVLRDIDASHSQPRVAASYSRALGNAIICGRAEARSDIAAAMLQEIRQCMSRHPEAADIREAMGAANVKVVYDATLRLEHMLADSTLAELRAIAEAHPLDTRIRALLAEALCNAVSSEPDRQDRMLNELRELSSMHSDQPELRRSLGIALLTARNSTIVGDDITGRKRMLLQELRRLVGVYANEQANVFAFAKGLSHAALEASSEQDFATREALLAELDALAMSHPFLHNARQL